jgi:DNA-nicking Smr family endonuclease
MEKSIMAKTKGISKADLQLWAAYAQSLQLLPGRKRLAVEPEPAAPEPAVPLAPRSDSPITPPKTLPKTGPVAVDLPPPGLDRASWKKFRKPVARPDRTLDLHGMTAARAHHAVSQFVLQAHGEKLRVIEIITGKGEVLLRELPHWLNAPQLRPLILALAHPHAANTGSVRVLLRRQRQGGVRP